MLPLEASRLKENNSLQNSRSELHIEKFKMYLTFSSLFAQGEDFARKRRRKNKHNAQYSFEVP